MEENRTICTYDDEIDLRECFRTLSKWKYTIIGIIVLAMLASALASKFVMEPVYEATAIVEIEPLPQMLEGLPQRSISSCEQMVTSDRVLDPVIRKLKLDESYTLRTLRKEHIKTEVLKDTNLIKITVNDKDPEQAAKMANEICTQFTDAVKADQDKQLVRLEKFVESQIAREERVMEDEVRMNMHKLTGGTVEAIMADSRILRQQDILADLERKKNSLEVIRASNLIGANVSVVSMARPHEEPVKPNIMLNTAVAGVLGLMLAVFGVFFYEYMKGEETNR
ncbi:MAG: hypothetical protein GXX09_10135 [Syntrophomonadaceae bacterium]|nr:hypothetical protein [Syntrophomonadaceae bacterium]